MIAPVPVHCFSITFINSFEHCQFYSLKFSEILHMRVSVTHLNIRYTLERNFMSIQLKQYNENYMCSLIEMTVILCEQEMVPCIKKFLFFVLIVV